MLTNKELIEIKKAYITLDALARRLITPDEHAVIECKNALMNIYATQKIKKKKSSEKTNDWNKAHPEAHRKHNNDYNNRHKKSKGGKII